MNNIEQLDKITLPKKLFYSMYEVCQKWEQFGEELEDFLLSANEAQISKLKKARREHLNGKTKGIGVLKKALG